MCLIGGTKYILSYHKYKYSLRFFTTHTKHTHSKKMLIDSSYSRHATIIIWRYDSFVLCEQSILRFFLLWIICMRNDNLISRTFSFFLSLLSRSARCNGITIKCDGQWIEWHSHRMRCDSQPTGTPCCEMVSKNSLFHFSLSLFSFISLFFCMHIFFSVHACSKTFLIF